MLNFFFTTLWAKEEPTIQNFTWRKKTLTGNKRNQQFRKWKTPKGPLTGLLVCSTFNTKMQTWNNVCCHFNCTRLFPFHNVYFWLFQFSSPHFASDQRDWPIFIRYFTKSGQSTILNWVGLSKLGKLLERLQKMFNILCLKTLPKHICRSAILVLLKWIGNTKNTRWLFV